MGVAAEHSSEVPQSYYYLWHLAALKVIDADFGPVPTTVPGPGASAVQATDRPSVTSTVWDRIAAAGPVVPARVALVDVGISPDHPNLATRLEQDRCIDLTSHPFGARTTAVLDDMDPYSPEQPEAFFAGLNLDGLGPLGLSNENQEYLESLTAEIAGSSGCVRRLINPEALFAAHGTACAGLIAGEPAAIATGTGQIALPEALFAASGHPSQPNRNRNLLPYFGVDPFSRLMSIRTSFDADPMQFIAAFLYAHHQQADVIVLPRGLPDPERSRLAPKAELTGDTQSYQNRLAADLVARLSAGGGGEELDPTSPQSSESSRRLWTILKHVILAVSRKIPIVCAAGNSAESQLIYPASLSAEQNGIIAVGAVTVEGFRSGYSNYGDGLTVVAPSDDDEVINRHQLRVDRQSPFHARHAYLAGRSREYRYSGFSLLTTDLPGSWGYDRGDDPWSSLPPEQNPGIGGGYYTSFGGTSGAAALIGGVCALIQRAHKTRHGQGARLDGVAVKSILVAASDHQRVVAPGFRPLTPDCMNADQEDNKAPVYFFGAGLPDAAAAVQAALAS
ncbi:MAG: S8 family serine peptidase [Alphaproteobacteria bacterium]|nr:S8 family serine peptidase [Alphaproteobacteria bacterium]MBU1552251.1 S8 family serine peptidase [Alphaproteobacteria bacterium]MBU2336841.1 S8 family serine peptidase [Alphaproteobacteria bacterium]MBU2389597.1 S8 family serine peptidase [Alphaproteobacteria bacterium]